MLSWRVDAHATSTKRKGGINAQKKMRLEESGIVLRQQLYEEQWEHMFGLLERFKNREGHCKVPYNTKEEGRNLGSWLCSQRERN
jgi:hypothetical protein